MFLVAMLVKQRLHTKSQDMDPRKRVLVRMPTKVLVAH
jgi:hypothetical protein